MGVYVLDCGVAVCGHCQASVSPYPSIFWIPARGMSCPNEGMASVGALMLCNMGNVEGRGEMEEKEKRLKRDEIQLSDDFSGKAERLN